MGNGNSEANHHANNLRNMQLKHQSSLTSKNDHNTFRSPVQKQGFFNSMLDNNTNDRRGNKGNGHQQSKS